MIAKVQHTTPPQVSDTSDTSDDEEEITLKQLQENIYRNRQLVTADVESGKHSSGSEMNDVDSSEDESAEPLRKKKKKIPEITFNWTKEDLPENKRNTSFMPDTNEDLLVPLEYFAKLFSLDIMSDIVEETNLYSTQDYWANGTRIERIASLMSVKRFKLLRRYIYFNNNDNITENTKDRYFKIRPVIEKVRRNFRKYHTENEFSIDETMVAYKGTRAGNLRQYIKNKPHKWGYKFFLIAGVSGYILDFIPYQGATTFDELKGSINEIGQVESDLGVGAGIIIALCKSLHDPCKATDKMNIYSLGTLRGNRIAGCPIETDKVLKKQGKGKYDYKIDKDKGLIIVKWVDNKVVLFGIKPTDTVKRFSKSAKKKVDVECHSIIKNYNKYMAGVDTANALMGLYKTPHKAKRWYFPIFAYLIDICVVNAWLLYRMDCVALKQNHTPLKQFRLEIAQALCRCGKKTRKGRPSSADSGLQRI
ncbi:hypothetical protein NQ314_012609 [Rhamnusium bicolor]|uniref:PiggyBac transposable element-derived protein domain-containing protein n=1 Tax=Rhamnusium bicolor TaxID=1586634 RepID=A0AAV8XCX2_9CUCU|nr:hypothetical protein NQ314_012609 [Rhamnusium bicolor]